MRATIAIDDAVLRDAKKAAAASGRTLGEVVEDALRLSLERPKVSRAARRLDLPTCGGDGPRPGVDLDDTAGLISSWSGPMELLDVNVLVYAHREDAPNHGQLRRWLEQTIRSDAPFGLTDQALAGFLRIVTHPRIFDPPSPLQTALQFVEGLIGQPNAVRLAPGARHWELFTRLCRDASVKGNLVPDAYLAALAIESGAELVTTDRDFARFPGLRWRHPLK